MLRMGIPVFPVPAPSDPVGGGAPDALVLPSTPPALVARGQQAGLETSQNQLVT